MLRKALLTAAAIVLSFLLTVLGGYALYVLSGKSTESELGWLARYILGPTIAVSVGWFVGVVSEDYAELVTAIALPPWAFISILHFPACFQLSSYWREISLALINLSIGAGCAGWAWRVRRSRLTPNT